jgi:hypothetical protein
MYSTYKFVKASSASFNMASESDSQPAISTDVRSCIKPEVAHSLAAQVQRLFRLPKRSAGIHGRKIFDCRC